MVGEKGEPFVYPYFIHDSYNSPNIINKFDWEKATNEELYPINNLTREYTRGLIQLRPSTDALTLGTKEEVDSNITLFDIHEIKEGDLAIAYRAVFSDEEEIHKMVMTQEMVSQETMANQEIAMAYEMEAKNQKALKMPKKKKYK